MRTLGPGVLVAMLPLASPAQAQIQAQAQAQAQAQTQTQTQTQTQAQSDAPADAAADSISNTDGAGAGPSSGSGATNQETWAPTSDAILIGGGYSLDSSQGQIELNVKWVQELLDQRSINISTFYTDGQAPGDDVHYLEPWSTYDSRLEPLARTLSHVDSDRFRHRNHTVENVAGSTERNLLQPRLEELLSGKDSNPTLLVYNGHGSQSQTSTDQVTLNLWNHTEMTAADLHELLGKRETPLHFVMTQCYSGGFHRLAYADSAHGLELAKGAPRCGFTAESAYRLSEGCSSSIDTSDYRDYTTFFFAALNGQDRNGNDLLANPDGNDDGNVTYREAHLYTLEHAFSTDLPRSTSEDYLTQWQPWYLRWLPASQSLPDNEYSAMYHRLGKQLGLATDVPHAAKLIRQALDGAVAQGTQHLEQQIQWRNQEEALKFALQEQLLVRWPSLAAPYSNGYKTLIDTNQMSAVLAFITEHPSYPQMLDVQKQQLLEQDNILAQERLATQYQKLLRLRRLAILKSQLGEFGSEGEVGGYERLVSCESSQLAHNPGAE